MAASYSYGPRVKTGQANLINFYLSPFLVFDSMRVADQNRLNNKKLKIIINNKFTNFIFCRIKFSFKYLLFILKFFKHFIK